MKRFIPAFFLLLFTSVFSAKAGEEPKDAAAPVEAVVIRTPHDCGYLLQLNDGQLIRPINFPRKFQKFNEHVLVVMDGMEDVCNSPCDIIREGYIVEIRFASPDPDQHAKYAGK